MKITCVLCKKKANRAMGTPNAVCQVCWDLYKPEITGHVRDYLIKLNLQARFVHRGEPGWEDFRKKHNLPFTVSCVKLHRDTIMGVWEK